MNIEIDRSTPDGRLMSQTVLIGPSTLLDELNETVAAIPKYIAAAASQPRLPDFPQEDRDRLAKRHCGRLRDDAEAIRSIDWESAGQRN
jgi:hypothetical protein